MQISVLGSTGSIGVQTLEVIENLNRNGYNIKIKALSANKNISLLQKQIEKFNPEYVCVCDVSKANELKNILPGIQILSGNEGLICIARQKVNIIVNAIVGFDGMLPTFEAICAKNDVALANKESLVIAGQLIMQEAKKNNVRIIPIDSEHSAILQSMQGYTTDDIEKIYLTASGGPFHKIKNLANVTLEQALKHPTWSMGQKISIDSATMINKGFEIFEACCFFDLPQEKVNVLVHAQSLIHSMVQFKDGCIIAQLGPSDMRLPIQYALTYPKRVRNDFKRLDFNLCNLFEFDKPNESLLGIELCRQAINIGGTMPAALCIANDIAVRKFLNKEFEFLDIYKFIKYVMSRHDVILNYSIEDVLELKNQIENLNYEV